MDPVVEYVTQWDWLKRSTMICMIPVVVMSFGDTSKFKITSASIAAISFEWSEDVTDLETSITPTIPVIVGIEAGTLVVGSGTGCVVGRAVMNAAQKNTRSRNKTYESIWYYMFLDP